MDEQNTPQQNPDSPNTQQNILIIILLVILVLIVSSVAGYAFYQNNQLKKQITQLQTQTNQEASPLNQPSSSPESNLPTNSETTPSLKPKESYIEDTSITGQKRYVSPRLGISFLFMKEFDYGDWKQVFTVTETENRIYIHTEDSNKNTGKYVEFFEKEPQKSLEQTLKDKFEITDKCKIEINPDNFNFPKTYTRAWIKYQGERTTSLGETIKTAKEHCPSPYTSINGIAYFITSSEQPEKMAFLSVGQDCLNADNNNNLCWHETVRFIAN